MQLLSQTLERRGGKKRGLDVWCVMERCGAAASDVGDSTFAVLLHGDLYVGGGDVALLPALLPGSGPAVPLVLLDDVQHLHVDNKKTRQGIGSSPATHAHTQTQD